MKKKMGFLMALVLLLAFCTAAWAEGGWAEERKAAREFTAGSVYGTCDVTVDASDLMWIGCNRKNNEVVDAEICTEP